MSGRIGGGAVASPVKVRLPDPRSPERANEPEIETPTKMKTLMSYYPTFVNLPWGEISPHA